MSGAVDSVRALLGGILRVNLSDGRIFEGRLSCLDSSFNVVLNDAREICSNGEKKPPLNPRIGGVVLIPGAHIVKCFAPTTPPHTEDNSIVS